MLSDRVTHHTLTVFGVDRARGTIDLVDAWPGKCFLLEDLNEEGIAAETIPWEEGRSLLGVRLDELERILVASASLNVPELALGLLETASEVPDGLSKREASAMLDEAIGQ